MSDGEQKLIDLGYPTERTTRADRPRAGAASPWCERRAGDDRRIEAPSAAVHSYCLTFAIALFLWIGGRRACSDEPAETLPDGVRSHCYDVLTRALRDESLVVRVHAAESLTSLDRPEPVLDAFRPKSKATEPVTRILVWRVLAAAEPDAQVRLRYVQQIRTVLLDPSSPDSVHAMESLAKLNAPSAGAERRLIREVADGAGPAAPFALWRLAQAGEGDCVPRLVKLLHSNDGVTRLRAAYVLGRIRPRYPAARDALAAALATEPPDSPSRPMLRAAADSDTARELLGDTDASPGDRYFAAMFLADIGAPSDYPRLTNLLRNPHSDLRVGAAYAMLKINGRAKPSGSRH